ncbi:MAG: NAD(P)-binding domain-containing protein [Verrucomicrobiota bacterium]
MSSTRKSLAIIGAGSSGLITLKIALQHLPEWDIVCYEKSSSIQGCWGYPYEGFVSTSTKFTTQFNCHQKYDASVAFEPDYSEFFQNGQYGEYLEDFAKTFELSPYIQRNTEIAKIERDEEIWRIHFSDTSKISKAFTHLAVCTGLAQRPKSIETDIPSLGAIRDFSDVRQKTVLVIGGGESAADTANRLASTELGNTVYLSLRQGIRVSPRYHPIRGVPSDFLRNRLMLSISPGLRNRIGQKFVESRIKYQDAYHRLFPSKRHKEESPEAIKERRREWDLRFTKSAKDQLFNVFHNKSDGFLDAVGGERIRIIGPPSDGSFREFYQFQSEQKMGIDPDLIVPQIGYQSNLPKLFDSSVAVSDFYKGCVHQSYENLFLVGFARPIIGNIPAIAEQQAKYIISLIKGTTSRPTDITETHRQDRGRLKQQFPTLNTEAIYPVEMFPYCDLLARERNAYPTRKKVKSFKRWLKIMLCPASTSHYIDEDFNPQAVDSTPTYTPLIFNILLLIIKKIDRIRS